MEFEQKPSLRDRLMNLWHEGNVRHVIVRKEARTIADLPLTIVVVGTLLAPWLAAILALIALLTGYHIEMRREGGEPGGATPSEPPTAPEAPPQPPMPDPAPGDNPEL